MDGVLGKSDYKTGLKKLTIIFQVEIYALAVEECLRQKWRSPIIRNYSDRQVVLSTLNSNGISSPLVWRCHRVLLKLVRLNETFLLWVPEHSTIAGNEKAERLARQSYGFTTVGPEPGFWHPAIRPNGEFGKTSVARLTFLLFLKKWDMETWVAPLMEHCSLN